MGLIKKMFRKVEKTVSDGAKKVLGNKAYNVIKGAAELSTGVLATKAATDAVRGKNPLTGTVEMMRDGAARVTTASAPEKEPAPPSVSDPIAGLEAYAANLALRKKRRSKASTFAATDGEDRTNTLGNGGKMGA